MFVIMWIFVQHTHGGRVGAGAWSGPGGTVDRKELSDGFLQGYRVPLEPPSGRLPKCSSSTVFLLTSAVSWEAWKVAAGSPLFEDKLPRE